MGGHHERIVVYTLWGEDQSGGAEDSVGTFDAGKAQCYLQRDRDKLLAVIETGTPMASEPSAAPPPRRLAPAPTLASGDLMAGYGDLQPFSAAVRAILQATCASPEHTAAPSSARRDIMDQRAEQEVAATSATSAREVEVV